MTKPPPCHPIIVFYPSVCHPRTPMDSMEVLAKYYYGTIKEKRPGGAVQDRWVQRESPRHVEAGGIASGEWGRDPVAVCGPSPEVVCEAIARFQ